MEILETIVVGMSQNVKKKTKSQGMELTNQSWRLSKFAPEICQIYDFALTVRN